MKKIFSNYYKIILSVVILIVLVALKEDYKTSFDGMSGVRTVVRMLLYTAWGFLIATGTRRDKAKGAEYVAFGVACVAALNLLIPIWSFQIAFYAFVAGVPGLYFMVFMGTEGHPTSGLIDAFCEGYRIGDDLYIAGQEKLGAIDLNTKEFRYCREEKSWAEDITQGVKITTAE